MKTHSFTRYLTGYLIGFSVFFLVIPYSLYLIATKFNITISASFSYPLRFVVALILGGIGLFFVLWSNLALLVKGKGGPTDAFNVAISPRTRHLVVTGPYRYTRNPMVFGAFSFYFALAIYWNSFSALAVLISFFIAARFYLKATEEKRLMKDFGKEYEEYRKEVGMIIPRPPKKMPKSGRS